MACNLTVRGYVKGTIWHDDGTVEYIHFPNCIVLDTGRWWMAKLLTAKITNILMGDGGCSNGKVKEVLTKQKELFGTTRLKKKIIPHTDPKKPLVSTFAITIEKNEANGYNLNEMALQLDDGTLYCMATFPDLAKTERMRIGWEWEVDFSE